MGYTRYIDGIHGTPYIAAPWIRHGIVLGSLPIKMVKSTRFCWLNRGESSGLLRARGISLGAEAAEVLHSLLQ
jgi:hypothetical protein